MHSQSHGKHWDQSDAHHLGRTGRRRWVQMGSALGGASKANSGSRERVEFEPSPRDDREGEERHQAEETSRTV